MKYRSDFVTNSSSSSFIVVFGSKDEYVNRLQNMLDKGVLYEYASVIARDVEENRVTKAEAMKEIIEALMDEFEFTYFYGGQGRYVPYKEQLKVRTSREFISQRSAYVEKELKNIKARLPKRGYYASIVYGDDDGSFYSDLEHRIMPNMPFLIKRISHH